MLVRLQSTWREMSLKTPKTLDVPSLLSTPTPAFTEPRLLSKFWPAQRCRRSKSGLLAAFLSQPATLRRNARLGHPRGAVRRAGWLTQPAVPGPHLQPRGATRARLRDVSVCASCLRHRAHHEAGSLSPKPTSKAGTRLPSPSPILSSPRALFSRRSCARGHISGPPAPSCLHGWETWRHLRPIRSSQRRSRP